MPDIDWVLVSWVACGLVALRMAHYAGVFRELADDELGPVWVAIATPMIFLFGWVMVAIFVGWAACYGTYKLATVPGPWELRARRRQRKAKEQELKQAQMKADEAKVARLEREVLDA